MKDTTGSHGANAQDGNDDVDGGGADDAGDGSGGCRDGDLCGT